MNMIMAGDPPIEITLRCRSRMRRLSLRVSRIDGRVTLNMPRDFPLDEARAFVEGKEDWIRRQLANAPEVIPVRIGGQILFGGRHVDVLSSVTSDFGVAGDALLVPGCPETAAHRLQEFLVRVAAEQLRSASGRHAKRIGRPYGKITLRDTRSRWGSCSSQGNLMLP